MLVVGRNDPRGPTPPEAFAQLLAEVANTVDYADAWTPAELSHTFAAGTAREDARLRVRIDALVAANDQLRRAVETRDTIGQMKCMLMERFQVGADGASKLLVKVSQNADVPVELIARTLIEIDHPAEPS